MQLVSTQIENYQKNSSWIRRMFEAGIELKKKYGEEAVCDFSLGNPDLTPPKAIIDGIKQMAIDADKPAHQADGHRCRQTSRPRLHAQCRL